jgi:hypothetical protein
MKMLLRGKVLTRGGGTSAYRSGDARGTAGGTPALHRATFRARQTPQRSVSLFLSVNGCPLSRILSVCELSFSFYSH